MFRCLGVRCLGFWLRVGFRCSGFRVYDESGFG